MSQQHNPYHGSPRRGRGNNRGSYRGNRRGHFHNKGIATESTDDIDYSPEAIEQRFSRYYLPIFNEDPWAVLMTNEHLGL